MKTQKTLEEFSGAVRFDLERRNVSGEAVDASRYVRAHGQARSLSAISRTRPSSSLRQTAKAGGILAPGSWEQLGPNNVAGRSRTLLIDPRGSNANVLYTAGPAGGIWKSTDAGQTWRPLNDFLPILAIGSLLMDPRNPNILYAGTGDNSIASYGVRGAGIYKSIDAGETWQLLPSTAGSSDFRFVRSLAISPADSQRIYAATNKGVLRSTDGGETWTLVHNRDVPNRGCQQVVIRSDKKEADYMFASCGVPSVRSSGALLNKVEPGEDPNAPAAIFVNTDAGNTGEDGWQVALAEPNMGHSSIALAPSNQDYVYILASSVQEGLYKDALLAVFRSTTGGLPGSFQARLRNTDIPARRLSTMILSNPSSQLCFNSPASQAWFVNTISVDPRNPERLFAASVDAFRSDDGGATWGQASMWDNEGARAYAHADHHAIVFHPAYNGVDNQTVFLATDSGIFRSDNALNTVATTDQQLCAGSGVGVVWRAINRNLATTQFYHGSVYPGGHAFVGGLQDNGTQRGSAGGADFRRLLGGDGAFTAIDALDTNVIYGSSQNFGLRRSVDGGATFAVARTGITEPAGNFAFVAPMAQDPRESRLLWAGGRMLWRTNNGAVTWTAASGPIAIQSFSAIVVSPHDSNIVFAGTRTGEIFRTNTALTATAETEWAMSKARTGWVSSILPDASDPAVVYAVYSSFNREEGDAHLYKSVDGGETWSALDGGGAGLPDAPYFSIVQHPENPAILFLAGDLGIFVSTDAGSTWAREDESFPAIPTQYLTVERDGGSGSVLYAFTYGRGVWRVRLSGNPADCTFSLTPTGNVQAGSGGGLLTRTLAAGGGCRWSAFSNTTWIRVVSAPSGAGPTEVRLLIDANDSGSARTGTITVAGLNFVVAQPATQGINFADEAGTAPSFTDLPYAAVMDTRSATAGGLDPTHSCTNSRDNRSVWFRYQASVTRTVTASVIGYRYDVFGNPGTVIAAYLDGNPPGNELACAVNNSQTPTTSSISFEVTAGQYYLIQVSGVGANGIGGYLVFSMTAASPGADVLPRSLDFGNVFVDETAERRFIIKNSGNQVLNVVLTLTNPGGEFAIAGSPVNVTIPVGGQREWIVRFMPKGEGSAEGALRFGGTTVPLRGSGASR